MKQVKQPSSNEFTQHNIFKFGNYVRNIIVVLYIKSYRASILYKDVMEFLVHENSTYSTVDDYHYMPTSGYELDHIVPSF